MSFKRKPPPGNVRRVRSTGQNLRGVITNKTGRLVQFESWLERGLILRLDRDPEVLDYQSQPERLIFSDGPGQQRSYTPDFKVWRRDSTIEMHEVSLTKRRMRTDLRRREQAARQICQRRGWRYIVHTEQTLPHGSELANLLALAGYRPAVYANQAVTEAVLETLAPHQTVTLAVLVKQIGQKVGLLDSQVTAALCHQLWHGRLQTNLDQLLFDQGTIERDAPVWLARQEANDGPSVT